MKTVETEQTPLIYMNRKEDCWRIDADSFPAFIAHLRHFFAKDLSLQIDTDNDTVAYADIDGKGLCIIAPLFGAVDVRRSRLALKRIFPERYLVTWEDSLTLRLCLSNRTRQRICMVHLKMKTIKP